ncbi:ABC transporter permease [Streptomyces sp. NPDC052396]|uniref:ABC transporter permease n=1 Tax=Streptomyces sp. NPDC052396 TaxID=3365689 RepID=UPI0037D37EF1
MTAAPAVAAAGRRRPGGLAWLVLRQHRGTVLTASAVLLVAVAQLVFLRLAMVSVIDGMDLRQACAPTGLDCVRSWSGADRFIAGYGDALHYNGLLVEILPALIAAFTAGPLIARELESGTCKLAWTQSVTPLRWLAAKLALPLTASLAGAGLLSAVYTWTWSVVPPALLPGRQWYQSFDMIGVVPVAGAVLGTGVGALAGVLVRRTLPAMAVALAGYPTLTGALARMRPYLLGADTATSAGMPALTGDDSWRFERGMTGNGGARIPEPDCGVGVSPEKCLAQHHADQWYLDYHPASHLWPLQWIEGGLLAALGVLAGWAALRLVRRLQP